MSKHFEISIDHEALKSAKQGFDACMKHAIARAIGTGSNEGSVTLKVSFEINEKIDDVTGVTRREPDIRFKTAFSVPLKGGIDGKVIDQVVLMQNDKGDLIMVNGQVSMDEILGDEK